MFPGKTSQAALFQSLSFHGGVAINHGAIKISSSEDDTAVLPLNLNRGDDAAANEWPCTGPDP
ncbi:MAG: hypothetical protein GYA24_08795 [Candidatus Lokiarchaeota archaeon]|nr:hypothetical protein [Candidatus Lokiarchaeota archaeon]